MQLPAKGGNNVVGQWSAVTAHVKLLHVAYRGGPAAVEGIASGDVPLGIVQPPAVYPGLVEAGKIKVIALTGSKTARFLAIHMADVGRERTADRCDALARRVRSFGNAGAIVARVDQAISRIVQTTAFASA